MKDLFRLDGKVAVVIGGAGGIGQGIAEAMAFYGAEVVIASRKMESLCGRKVRSRKKWGRMWPSTRWMPPMRTASLPWSTPW